MDSDSFDGEGSQQLDTIDLEELFAGLTDENTEIIFEDDDDENEDCYGIHYDWN